MGDLIVISGMLAFISLILSATTGLMIFKFHVKWAKMQWHITSAVATVIFALIHVGLILYSR